MKFGKSYNIIINIERYIYGIYGIYGNGMVTEESKKE